WNSMEVKLIKQAYGEVCAQWVLWGVFEEDREETPENLRGSPLEERIRQLFASRDVAGTLGELTPLFGVSGLAADVVLLVGMGSGSRFDAGAAYRVGMAAAKRLAAKERESVAIVLPPVENAVAIATALVEGAIVGTRGPGLRKSEQNRHPFGSLGLI